MKLAEQLEQRVVYEKMLAEISEHAVSIENISSFISTSLETMGTVLEVTRVFLFTYTQSTDTFHCYFGWDSPIINQPEKPEKIVLHIPWATREFSAGKILNYADVRKIPGSCYRKHLIKTRIKSTLNVPLFVQGTLFGFIGFDEHRYHREWIEEDIYILTTAAQILTRTIENKKYEEELEQHRSLLESIFSSVQDAIITVDTHMNIIEANKAAATMCGIHASKGCPFLESTRQCTNSCVEALKKTLQEKSIVREFRVQCDLLQEPCRVAMVNCSPLHNRNGSFIGAVLVIRDITRLTRLENKLHERQQFESIVGGSAQMNHIYGLLNTLASLGTTVLITGESGTGKEMVAQALHYGGQRAALPFVKVNCSALAENLLENELFGHVKGAFTGADKDSVGRFEAAGAGTILLDEIGDISPLIQLKLLRVLQEKEFERVGEFKARKLEARVLASTNRDLKQAIQEGKFREDLYYRLNVMDIHIPPLRERLEDISPLIDHFIKKFNTDYQKNIEDIEPDTLALLLRYPWPGNIRELEHVLERAVILCPGQTITHDHLPVEICKYIPQLVQQHPSPSPTDSAEEIRMALHKTDGNISKAARLLRISRWTLYRKIQKFGLLPPRQV